MKITVIQPRYNAGARPDEKIADFLLREAEQADGELIVLPEYANAGGLSDPEKLMAALPRAEEMLQKVSELAKEKAAYISVNVFLRREGKLRNSTYLFDRGGNIAFIYDKIHLPPAEVKLGIVPGDGQCVADVDGIRLNCIQSLFCALLSAVVMLLTEEPAMENILRCWLPLGYAGILSMGVAYSLQIIGQKDLDPTVASLLMSLESVFAVLFAWLLLHEQMSAYELTGCGLVFGAVILSQLPVKEKNYADA